ncbi:MAG: hypothetical protein NVSMB27_13480 [Ktedonobacteraceae bacterium]
MSDAADEKQQALKQIEDVFQERGRLFQAVWDCTSDAMALSTPDGSVFAANSAYYQLYGLTPDEVIGNNFAIIFPEEERKMAQELYEYFFQSPAIGPSVESPIRRADGSERFVESSYTFITDHDQRIAMLSIIRDVTERKRIAEALWISEEKLRIALEVGHMESWDWDIQSNSIRWSARSEASTDRDSTYASYETFLEVVHLQDRALVDQEMRRALKEGTDYSIEFRVELANGTIRWTKMQGQVLNDEADKPMHMMGITMDIPQSKPAAGVAQKEEQ